MNRKNNAVEAIVLNLAATTRSFVIDKRSERGEDRRRFLSRDWRLPKKRSARVGVASERQCQVGRQANRLYVVRALCNKRLDMHGGRGREDERRRGERKREGGG